MNNSSLLLYIYFPFSSGASGGGNNFLKSLKSKFKENNQLAQSIDDAHVIIFNSHHAYRDIYKLKAKYPEKAFIQRIDGPMSAYNNSGDVRDYIVKRLSEDIADASIFQSDWCKKENDKYNVTSGNTESTVIWNAPNPQYFNFKKVSEDAPKKKIVSTGWSVNKNKGSDTYLWLDKNLDFNHYEMDFIGNTELEFKNIKLVKPMSPEELGAKLHEYDYYIFPSRTEACSNALMEALHSGLPTIAFNGSSNLEIIPDKKWLFKSEAEIPSIISYMKENYSHCHKKIRMPSLEEITNHYYLFSLKISEKKKRKSVNNYTTLKALFLINLMKIKAKIV